LASLATEVVEVPTMETGGVVLKPALITVRKLLQDVADALRPLAEDRGITIHLVANEAAPAELIADPDRVRQAVVLLLSEAIRTAAPDTMWLLADGGETESEALRVTIRTLGPPIPEAARATMFPAVGAVAAPDQSDASASYDRGTSLGPAIARYLTQLMGGDLRCEGWSTLDGRTGNDFILSLPPDLLPGQRGRAPGQAPAEGRPSPRTRILMIGALTGLRMAEVTMLRRDGHMVETIGSAHEAIELLNIAPFDVVFIDMELAGERLETAIRTIRDVVGPGRDVPLVVLAPPHQESEARMWREAGASDVMPANPTLEEFAAGISRNVWLNRSVITGLGFMPGREEESEEGIPILAADRIAELQANIPPDELLDMAEECISDLYRRLPALRRSLAAEAPGAITAQAHAMVGMAGGYGMAVLEARLRAIQAAVRMKRMSTIDGAAAVVEADLTRAAAALRRTLRYGQPAKTDVKA
jgi:CheY-like chemotaxis protein